MNSTQELIEIWNQKAIPVILRRGKGKRLRVRLPYQQDNRAWLRGMRHSIPEWIAEYRCWEVPQSWFNELVEQLLERYRKLYIIQPYRELEVCAPACWNAVGHECQCSCMGANHGSHGPGSGWYIVSDTFAARWGQEHVACRLLTRK